MRLQRIEISNFRCFDRLDVPVDGKSLFLIGENGGGKTSLLTAIARSFGRDLSFTRADFRNLDDPIEITATLDDLDADQRAELGNSVDFQQNAPARLRVRVRAVWDPASEEPETEHVFPKLGSRSTRAQRDAISVLWLPAWRDVARLLQLGTPRNIIGQLLAGLPLDASTNAAIDAIGKASERFSQDPSLQALLTEAGGELDRLLPDVEPDTYSLGLSATTGRDLLRQFELVAKHGGAPISISQQSSGLAQLSVFVFALKLSNAMPGVMLLIDEPEVSLHPQAQRSLVGALRALQAQAIIATHSSNLLERGDPRSVARMRASKGNAELAFPATLDDQEAARLARFTNPHAAEAFFARAAILVEGDSDRLAVEALAQKQGRSLDSEGITVVPINGATKAEAYIALFGPKGFQIDLAGLCDDAEARYFAKALQRAGIAQDSTTEAMEKVGFFVCSPDLEAELIEALGTTSVQKIIDAQGDLSAFNRFQQQPEWNTKTLLEQLVGFVRKRKVEYAPILVDAMDVGAVPSPLQRVLAAV